MKISDIEKLIKILENSKISTIEITDFWGRKLKLIKGAYNVEKISHSSPSIIVDEVKETRPVEKKPEGEVIKEKEKNLVAIRSPIVGTFIVHQHLMHPLMWK